MSRSHRVLEETFCKEPQPGLGRLRGAAASAAVDADDDAAADVAADAALGL